MPYNGSGVFTRLYNFVQDAANGINIRADRMDGELSGIATGLSNAMTRDSQAPMTQNLKMGNKKIINLADPTIDQDAATKKWVDDNFIDVLSGGLFQWGDALTSVIDFNVGVQSGWYHYTPASLNPPPGSGGALMVPRLGIDAASSRFSWIAFNASGGTGNNEPHVYVATTSGGSSDKGVWRELLTSASLATLATIDGIHTWTAEQIFNGTITLPLTSAGVLTAGGAAMGAANQLRLRFGGSGGGAGTLMITAQDAQWISIKPDTREINSDGTINFLSVVNFASTISGTTTFSGPIVSTALTTGAILSDVIDVTSAGNASIRLNDAGPVVRGIFRKISADNSVQFGAMNGATALSTLRAFPSGELKQESGWFSGINFGSGVAASATDLSRHIDLYGGIYGINVTSGAVNLNMGGSALFYFRQGGTIIARVDDPGTAVGASYSVITREKGDFRYFDASNLSTGTMSSARLPATSGARDWVGDRTADLSAGAIGSYAFAYLITEASTAFGTIRNASDLRPVPVGNIGSGSNLPGSTWMCCGRVMGSGNDAITMWKRMT